MYWPCLVRPYQGSPSRWKILLSRLTQTIPLPGGGTAWVVGGVASAGAGAVVTGTGEGAGRGAVIGVGAAAVRPTVTRGVIVSMVLAGTPALARSWTAA